MPFIQKSIRKTCFVTRLHVNCIQMQTKSSNSEKISICITVGNEEASIRTCLESVRWADEIVVVDSFSTDKTIEIAREYTDLVYQHKWLGYIGQKNLIKELANGPWVMFIDADEVVSNRLKDEIIEIFNSNSCRDIAGYMFPRLVRYLGRWITHGDWYPDFKLRLFRKEKGRCLGKEPHDRTVVEGPVKKLKGDLYHFTYVDFSDQMNTINKFSSISASGMMEEKHLYRLSDLVFRPFFKFIRSYLLKKGFLDGTPGLIIAVATSFAVFAKYAKLWEAKYTRHTGHIPPD